MHFFDPLCAYVFPKRSKTPGRKFNFLKDQIKICHDQLSPFVWEEYDLDMKKSFPKTFFRLALRTSVTKKNEPLYQHDIISLTKLAECIESIFTNHGHELLLFLKKITRIRYGIRDDNGIKWIQSVEKQFSWLEHTQYNDFCRKLRDPWKTIGRESELLSISATTLLKSSE